MLRSVMLPVNGDIPADLGVILMRSTWRSTTDPNNLDMKGVRLLV
jgi:hypothetical protein